jgi:CubicO group peptidase (beta-lactamase class C family)
MVQNEKAKLSYSFSTNGGKPFLAASITKLLTTVLLLKLEHAGKLRLSDPLEKYLSSSELKGLLVKEGQELAGSKTLASLAANTSGIADYYQLKRLDPESDIPTSTKLDPGWSFADVLEMAKSLPNELDQVSKRASYSFTNFQILSEVIERVTDDSLGNLFEDLIFTPCEMSESYLLTPNNLPRFSDASEIKYGTQIYLGASRMASLRGEGALVSSATDLVAFMAKLSDGVLIDKSSVAMMREPTNKLYPLIRYGLGTMKLQIPGPLLGSLKKAELYGHLGATGSFAFHEPKTSSFFVGTVNQLQNKKLGVQMLIELVAKTLRRL